MRHAIISKQGIRGNLQAASMNKHFDTYLQIGSHQNLSPIRRISQIFNITNHSSIEYNFPCCGKLQAKKTP